MAGVRILRAYRASGADLPFGDPTRAHGVAMEGYFWRFTSPSDGRSVIALIGVNRGGFSPPGDPGSAAPARPGSWPWTRTTARLRTRRPRRRLSPAFVGDHDHVRVRMGHDARLDVRISAHRAWDRRRWGGSSVFQVVPGLNQYWHPWLLGGRASGSAVLGGEHWDLGGWQVYAEKNWGRGGFPDSWWWGQAQGFAEPEACVAFAGGLVTAGPLRTTVTGLVVRLPDGRLLRLGDPLVSPVRADVSDESWSLRGRGFGWEVDVEASAPLAAAHVLPVPLPAEGRNTAGAIEHLGGALEVSVRRRGRLVWSGRSAVAGLEHGGLARAEAELRRRGVPPGAVGAPPPGARS